MTLITGLALLQSSHFSLSAIVSRESCNSVAALSELAKCPASPPSICCPEIVYKGNAHIEAYRRPSGSCSTAVRFRRTPLLRFGRYTGIQRWSPSPSGAAFEVNGCSIVPVKRQKMLHRWRPPDKIQQISISRRFFKILSRSKSPPPPFTPHSSFSFTMSSFDIAQVQ